MGTIQDFNYSTIFFFLQEYRTTFCKILEKCKNKYDPEYGVDFQFAKQGFDPLGKLITKYFVEK